MPTPYYHRRHKHREAAYELEQAIKRFKRLIKEEQAVKKYAARNEPWICEWKAYDTRDEGR